MPLKFMARPGYALGLTLWLIAGIVWSVGSSRPSHTFAQPIPVPAASTNTYWAGYVATAGPYTEVEGSWTVPMITCPHHASNSTAYVWLGEGGYLQGLASSLIQAGTGSDCLAGVPRYHAFYEWYPDIYATDFPLEVSAGDDVSIRIQEAQPNYWIITFRDDTTNTQSTTATIFHADTGSADFIVERPSLCDAAGCSQTALSRFRSVTFHDIGLRNAGGARVDAARGATSIALVDPTGEHSLAVPARAGAELSVLWRRGW